MVPIRAEVDHGRGEGSSLRLPHLPALDGLRGLAVVGVVGFHAGISWLRGGYLPLTAFFVLSGFLITSLLLLEVERTGRIDLRAFWKRRARRLVPAALLGLAVAGVIAVVTDTGSKRLQGDATAALAWVTNWRLVETGQSYENLFSQPSPLQHYWSLAIEEQFYVLLPLLAFGLLVALGRGRRRYFVATVAALTVGSIVLTRVLHQPGDSPLRTYYGTDTRAAELLVGVLLAVALVGRAGLKRLSPRMRIAWDVAGVAGLAATVALWCTVNQFDDWLFEGGLFLVALLSAAVVVAGTQEGTVVARLLSFRPLAALGRISYGVYVLHWPLFLLLSEERTGLDPAPLLALRTSVVVLIALGSYAWLEQPVRLGRLPRRIGGLGWANGAVAVVALFAVAGTAVTAGTVTLRAEGAAPPPPPPPPPETAVVAAPAAPVPVAAPPPAAPPPTVTTPTTAAARVATTVAPRRAAPAAPAPKLNTGRAAPAPQPPPPTTAPAPAGGTTSAAAPKPPLRVLVLGDSLAQNIATGLLRVEKKSKSLVVWDHGVTACTLGRGGTVRAADGSEGTVKGECGWWGTEQADREIASFRPDVVLIVGGINDLFDRKLPSWSDHHAPGDETFDSWLLSEYRELVEAFRRRGAPLLWIPAPCADTVRLDGVVQESEQRRDHIASAILAPIAAAGVRLADIDTQLCPDGEFDPDALGIENSRPDGLHVTDEASEVLANRWLVPLLMNTAGR